MKRKNKQIKIKVKIEALLWQKNKKEHSVGFLELTTCRGGLFKVAKQESGCTGNDLDIFV